MRVPFTKMQGCGNDYIFFDCPQGCGFDPSALSRRLSDRHYGIGGDGIVLILPGGAADAQMRMFNADGSEGEMCGNAIRCVGRYLYDNGRDKKTSYLIDTLAGQKQVFVRLSEGKVKDVSVNMGAPKLEGEEIPAVASGRIINRLLPLGTGEYAITCVNMGNPHCVILTPDLEMLNLPEIGPKIENDPFFPQRVNTEFVRVEGDNLLRMRVWERGSGETLSCGTGACAAAVAAVLNGYVQPQAECQVRLPGGSLYITWKPEGVFMRGEAERVFDGEVEV